MIIYGIMLIIKNIYMEGTPLFVSIVIIVFGVLQIILFFKLWRMTNRVKEIDHMMQDRIHDYEFYMLSGQKEKAYNYIRSELINKLIDLQRTTYSIRFITAANKIMPRYIKKMQETGFEVPKHLLSAESFIEYRDKLHKL